MALELLCRMCKLLTLDAVGVSIQASRNVDNVKTEAELLNTLLLGLSSKSKLA